MSAKEERSKVTQGRDELLASLPKRVAKRYEKLRARESKYMSVAIIDSGTCISCQMKLPPQLFIEVQRGEDFKSCPQCNALLVYASFSDDAPPDASGAEVAEPAT